MKLTQFSVKNYQFTLIVFVALVAIGLNSLFNMPRGEDPDFQAPQFAIVVVYPGTSPSDMEQLVVNPIEKKMNELSDIKKITTRIDDGLTIIRLDFKYETNPNDKYQEVVREFNSIRATLPPEILSTDIMKFSPSDVSIVQVGLMSEVATYQELEQQSKKLKEELEKIKSLKNVQNHAFPQQQVRISINLERLAANKVPLNNVLQGIQSENANIPGGSIEMNTKKLNVKTSGEYKSIEEIENTVIKSTGQNIVRIKDVADVTFDYAQESYKARLNGKRAVWVTASRKMGTNVFDVDDLVRPTLQNFEKQL